MAKGKARRRHYSGVMRPTCHLGLFSPLTILVLVSLVLEAFLHSPCLGGASCVHWNGELASSYVNVAAILLEMFLLKKLQCLIPWTYSRKGVLRRQKGG